MNLFSRLFHQPDLVITIHGFGRRTDDEMKPIAQYLEQNGFEVWTFPYYDPEDEEDTDFQEWISRCEEKVKQAIQDGRKVHLLGFSMGGVIASYLASVYPVENLCLCAPAFYPYDFSKIEQAARKKLTSSKDKSLSSAHTKAFMKVVSNYRNSIDAVECPILMLHGTADEVIQPASSSKVFSRLANEKKYLLWIEGAKHRFLYDGPFEALVFPMIRDYFRVENVLA